MPQRRKRTVPRASLSGRFVAFLCAIWTDWICSWVYLCLVSRASMSKRMEHTLGASMMTFGWRLVYDILSQVEAE